MVCSTSNYTQVIEEYMSRRLIYAAGAVWPHDQSGRHIGNLPTTHEWQPIQYTSLTGYMFANYLLLACLVALPMLIVYQIWISL